MNDEQIIKSARQELSHAIEDESVESYTLAAQALEQTREPLLSLRCKLQREYYQAREKLRFPKDKEYTDFDRITMLDAHTAEVREKYELVKGLEDLVKERVELIKILLEK